MFDYLKFYKTLASLSDDECTLIGNCNVNDEFKIANEEKCSVYHVIFKSRVEKFPKIRKNVSILYKICIYNGNIFFQFNLFHYNICLYIKLLLY